MSYALRVPTIIAAGHLSTLPTRDSALEQVCERIVDAGLAGARWVIFPEGCIPGYPVWVWTLRSGTDPLLDTLRAEVLDNTVRIPSDVTDRLCGVALRAQVNVVVGVIEREGTNDCVTTCNTLLFINAQGRIVGMYRIALTSESLQQAWVPAKTETPADESSVMSGISGI